MISLTPSWENLLGIPHSILNCVGFVNLIYNDLYFPSDWRWSRIWNRKDSKLLTPGDILIWCEWHESRNYGSLIPRHTAIYIHENLALHSGWNRKKTDTCEVCLFQLYEKSLLPQHDEQFNCIVVEGKGYF